jgi:hypothetical protein
MVRTMLIYKVWWKLWIIFYSGPLWSEQEYVWFAFGSNRVHYRSLWTLKKWFQIGKWLLRIFMYHAGKVWCMKYENRACTIIHALVPWLCVDLYIMELLSVPISLRALENVASPYIVCRLNFVHLLFMFRSQVSSEYEHFSSKNRGMETQNFYFLKNSFNNFDLVLIMFGDHLPK